MFGATPKTSAAFLHGQPAKEAHLKDSALALVGLRQPLQSQIHGDDVLDLLRRQHRGCIDRNVNGAASPFLAQPSRA